MFPRVSFQCTLVSPSNVSMCIYPMFPRVSFQCILVFFQCLHVSSFNVSMRIHLSNVSTCLLTTSLHFSFPHLHMSYLNVSNSSFHVSSHEACVFSSLSPIYLQDVHPCFFQPVSNPFLQMSSNPMSHSHMTSDHILIIFPLVTTILATTMSPTVILLVPLVLPSPCLQ